jgi:bifunctional DNase/RNase
MEIHMEVVRVLVLESRESQLLELREVEGERIFPIRIGRPEADAIRRRILGQKPLRPQTHELLDNVLGELGWDVEKVVINDLSEEVVVNELGMEEKWATFYARLHLRQGQQVADIDSRPSDAIALGVRNDVPIFVAQHVLEYNKPETG